VVNPLIKIKKYNRINYFQTLNYPFGTAFGALCTARIFDSVLNHNSSLIGVLVLAISLFESGFIFVPKPSDVLIASSWS
jgi:hypothetical protein